MKKSAAVLIVALFALALTACAPQVVTQVDVHEGGNVDFVMEFGMKVDPTMMAMMGSPEDIQKEMEADLPQMEQEMRDTLSAEGNFDGEVMIEPITDDGSVGIRMRMTEVPADLVSKALTGELEHDPDSLVAEVSSESSPVMFDALSIETGDDGAYKVSGTLKSLKEAFASQVDPAFNGENSEGEQVIDFGIDPEDLLKEAELSFRLTLPGRTTSQDATRVEEDGTLVWEAAFDESLPINAESSTAGGSSGTLVLALLGALLFFAAVAAGLIFVWRRSVPAGTRDSQPEQPEQPERVPVEAGFYRRASSDLAHTRDDLRA